jgi:hypothetical protein
LVQSGLAVAFTKAKERLQKSDPSILSMQTGTNLDEGSQLLSFMSLGDKYIVSFPAWNVHKEPNIKAIPKFALLTLHYLLSKPVPPTGSWISFKELPGGALYQTPFQNRTTGRLFRTLGSTGLKLLSQAYQNLGGEPMSGGDMAFKFSLFPYVPLGLVIWEGDDEFPPSGNILFDSNALYFLTTEDYAVLGEYLVEQLIANLPNK